MASHEQKSVLLFASKLGYQTRAFDAAARRLGVRLFYVTDRCHELTNPWGDDALAVRFDAPEHAAARALGEFRKRNFTGILALGDRPAIAAAYTARSLGLPGNHPVAVEACHNKLRTREIFRAAGLRTPWFRTVPLAPQPEPALLDIHYPCVMKPLSLSASQGVMRADNREEFLAGIERLKHLFEQPDLRTQRESDFSQALVEEYLPGIEVAVEGILVDGELKLLAIFDKPDPLEGPYFEETIYVVPSRLPAQAQASIRRTAESAIRAIGLSHGPVHAEFRINQRGIWPIEVAPRPIGGLCARSLEFRSPGHEHLISLEELILRAAIGEGISRWEREPLASGVMMIPVPSSGVLEKVYGVEEAQHVGGITEVEITARLHDSILAWPEGSSYLGFIFAKGETAKEVEQGLRSAHARLRFTIRETLPIQHPITGKFLNSPS
jgi:formate-dependent phosphoribosylglycinamide formyltransferase (GAR transformylase)